MPSQKRKKKILVVEDDPMIVKAISTKLPMDRFVLLEASNGREGLRLAIREHPNLILLDILMPTMDGIEMLKKLRSDLWGKTAKVVILTNLSNETKEKEAFDLGVGDYIIKADFKINEVMQLIEKKIKG